MSDRIPIAIVGLGKIARDQHVPSIAASDVFELIATASPHNSLEHVRGYPSIEQLLQSEHSVSAVALCMTPQTRYPVARYALQHGCHVLLEKPPGVTISEVEALRTLAKQHGRALFASWHSRHAGAVEAARNWLARRRIERIAIEWREDVRVWHPGQKWIWQAGGLGVFDPGINALSILTRIHPHTTVMRTAQLHYPSNCETPIAAQLTLTDEVGTPIQAQFDFRHTGQAHWDIRVDTDAGQVLLSMGGTRMQIDGQPVTTSSESEYASLYRRFAQLVDAAEIDLDLSPLQLVADAFLCGQRTEVAAFVDAV